MTTHHHFLAAILCDLGNTTPVLVYADWLEEEGETGAQWWRELAEALGAVRILGPEPEWIKRLNIERSYRHVYLLRDATVGLRPDAAGSERLGYVASAQRDEYGRILVWVMGHSAADIAWLMFLTLTADDIVAMEEEMKPRRFGTLGVVNGFINNQPYTIRDVQITLDNEVNTERYLPASATLPLSRLAAGVRQRLEERGVTPQEIEKYLGPATNPQENLRRLRGHAERIGMVGQVAPISTTQMAILEEAERIDRPPTAQERDSLQFWWDHSDTHPDT